MANRRADPVSYRPFRANPLLADGLLAVARDDGGLERRVAQGLANLADEFGQKADFEAKIAGEQAGDAAALAAPPEAATVTGGEETGRTVSPNGQAGHVLGATSGIVVRPTGKLPAGMRNNNPGNIKFTGTGAFRGVVGPSQNLDQGDPQAVFATPEDGMAAMFQLAKRKYDGGKTSANKLIAEKMGWTPGNYQAAANVARTMGVSPDADIALNDPAMAAKFMRALMLQEHGPASQMYSDEMISKAIGGVGGAVPASPGYAHMPNPAADGPVSVTPVVVRTPVEVKPGKAGGFRPRGGNSIYDRAYNVSGTRTYLQELETTMLQDQNSVYDAYKDDPVMLEKAMGQLLQAHEKEHVFPEIAADYRNAFQKQATVKIERARDAFQDRKLAQDKVDYLGRVDTLEDQKSRAIAGLEPNDENAATVLSNLQSGIDSHYDAGVARGLLTPEQADTYKRKSRSDAVTGFYVGQSSKMKADDIKAMRAEMTKDYADGGLEGVSADDWERIDKGLASAESARRTQDEKANSDLAKRGEDIAKRVARGLPVDPTELSRLQMDAATAPKGREILGSTFTRLKLSEAIRTEPIGDVEKKLPSILGDGATPDDVDFARKVVADHKKELAADPIGVAERFGILPVSPTLPLDGDVDPDAVSSAFSERINQARAAASHFGVQPKFFRPGEADQIEAAVKADPQRGLAIAAGLVDAGGPNADKILAELGNTAPAVSQSGTIVANGGDTKAALDLIAGYGKTPDGKDYPDMPNTKRLPIAQTLTGDALAFTPEEVNRVDASAAAIARKRIYDAGIDPKSEAAKPIYERAYQEAAGASFIGNVQYGGIGSYDRGWRYSANKVVVPPSIRADKFGDVIGALQDGDIGAVAGKNGKTWTAADFQKGVPVAVKGGYVFALGDPASGSPMFIADAKGNPVVLDLAGMQGKLQPRTPGAWR